MEQTTQCMRTLFSHVFYIALAWVLLIPPSHAQPIHPIVDSQWLAQNISQPNIRIIDARETQQFAVEHLAGSVNIPYPKLFDQNLNLPTLSYLQQLLSQAGIDETKKVVVLDDGGFKWAARLVWILHTLGHQDASLLNVGYGNWAGDLFKTTNQVTEVKPTQFVIRLNSQNMKSYLDTLVASQKPEITIIDSRPPAHYQGITSLAVRSGHIPSAINYPAVNNSINTGLGAQLLDLDELSGLFKELPKDKPLILYCNDGATSAINYVVLSALGYKASVYEGSWLEWGNNPALPIVNPSHKP